MNDALGMFRNWGSWDALGLERATDATNMGGMHGRFAMWKPLTMPAGRIHDSMIYGCVRTHN